MRIAFWSVHGIYLINAEPEGYSAIIIYGETRPVLKIPTTIEENGVVLVYKRGWKHLTAVYLDEFKERYLGTMRRTLVYYGRKVWINCPTVYFIEGEDTTLLFKADLFAYNRRVPDGNGYFKYHHQRVSPQLKNVVKGYVEEEFNTTHFEPNLRYQKIVVPNNNKFDLVPIDGIDYEFYYNGSEKYELSDGEGKGEVYIVKYGKRSLVVEVPTIITNMGDNCHTKLIARVYYKEHGTLINSQYDIPQGGYVTFYIDGKRVSHNGVYKWKVTESGYASMPWSATSSWGIGTHNIVATYTPDTPELKKLYAVTSGSGTLFIGDDTGKPCINSNDPWCTHIGNPEKTLTFTANKKMQGKLQMYIDGDLVPLKGSSAPDYSIQLDVPKNGSFTISFDTLKPVSILGYVWNFSGYHNLSICYTVDEMVEMCDITDEFGTIRTELMPMEYWYYFDDFYIQRPVELELEHEVDVNPYVDNLHYLTGNEDFEYDFHQPDSNVRERSLAVGSPLRVHIIDKEYINDKVNKGYVKVTFITRTENDVLGG